MQVRLQKVIAASGLASRRKAEELIQEGHVTVNGHVIWKMGTCVDPTLDHIKVNGRHVKNPEPEVFIMLHKPPGYVTSTIDPLNRPTIVDLLDRVHVRVFPVGRLDFDSEGLLLLTNNGSVAQACLHPKYHVQKTYLVKLSGQLTNEEIQRLEEGILLDDGMTKPALVRKSGKAKVNSWIEITIYEGRTHQIKRMLEAIGHRVLRLRRTRFGPLRLENLSLGAYRYVTDSEANALRAIPKFQVQSQMTHSRKTDQKTAVNTKRSGRISPKWAKPTDKKGKRPRPLQRKREMVKSLSPKPGRKKR